MIASCDDEFLDNNMQWGRMLITVYGNRVSFVLDVFVILGIVGSNC